jgi:Fic family protein
VPATGKARKTASRKAPAAKKAVAATDAAPAKAAGKPGRLPRRSPADIAKTLAKVVALVKSDSGGLRAEQIRERLGVTQKEMPRVLKEGLSTKALKSKGVKRSTTYTAA